MQYQINGKVIPKFAIGTWAWGAGINGSRMVFGTSADEDELKKAFDTAYQKGLILWDTAAVYGMGNAEKILGKFAANKNIILSDKYTQKKKFNAKDIEQPLNQSIERVGIVPDIYWLHLPINIEENLTYMCSLLSAGKIGSIGVSNFNLDQVKKPKKFLKDMGLNLQECKIIIVLFLENMKLKMCFPIVIKRIFPFFLIWCLSREH